MWERRAGGRVYGGVEGVRGSGLGGIGGFAGGGGSGEGVVLGRGWGWGGIVFGGGFVFLGVGLDVGRIRDESCCLCARCAGIGWAGWSTLFGDEIDKEIATNADIEDPEEEEEEDGLWIIEKSLSGWED